MPVARVPDHYSAGVVVRLPLNFATYQGEFRLMTIFKKSTTTALGLSLIALLVLSYVTILVTAQTAGLRVNSVFDNKT